MKVLNIHTRTINQPKAAIVKLFQTLASDNDMLLATHKWSPMLLDQGLKVGSKGGHGPIRYSVLAYEPDKMIEFEFSKPTGFVGSHSFKIIELDTNRTEIRHTIDMHARGPALLTWPLAIRWLHDAFIEDAFDKVENHFSKEIKRTKWNLWVRVLRKVLRPRSS